MSQLLNFAAHVLRDQLAHGASGDTTYIDMARDAIASEENNGWPNRETWAVNLYLRNDPDLYKFSSDLAKACFEGSTATVADNLKGYFEGLWFPVTKGRGEHQEKYCAMLQDIGSLWRVDWLAIAKALTEDNL